MINGSRDDQVTVSKFMVGQPDQKRVISNRVDELIRTIVELGGTYPDVVQALQQAKKCQALAGRFEVDALPEGDREYRHKDESDECAGRRPSANRSRQSGLRPLCSQRA